MNQALVMGVGIGLVAAAEIVGAGWILWEVFHAPRGDMGRRSGPVRVAAGVMNHPSAPSVDWGERSAEERMEANIQRWSEWLFRDEDRARDIPRLVRWGVTDRDEQEAALAGVSAIRQRIRMTHSIQWAQQMRERQWLREQWGPAPIMPLDAEGMREKRAQTALIRRLRWAEWRLNRELKDGADPGSDA